MDDASARRADEPATALIADKIRDLQRQHGFSAFSGVLLGRQTLKGPQTARVDHIIVDRFGLIVVSVASWSGAVVRGTTADDTWSVGYPDGTVLSCPNPLRAVESSAALLRQSLADAGWLLAEHEVESYTVFVDTDTASLELDPPDARRLVHASQLGDRYEARIAAAREPTMTAEAAANLVDTVARVNRIADPFFTTAHSVQYGGAKAGNRPVPAAAGSELLVETPWVPRPVQRPFPVVPVLAGIVGSIVLVTVTVLGARTMLGRPAETGWQPQATTPAAPASAQDTSAPAPVPASGSGAKERRAKVDIPLAKRKLKDVEPEVFPAIIEPDNPEISQPVDGQVTYKWDYMMQSGSNAVITGKASITLDAAGSVVHVSR